MLDLRNPIGYFFLINALLLIVDGLWLQPQTVPWGGININLDAAWGTIMGCFGVIMLWLARREKAPK